jgi:hypothetical protein
MFLRLATLGALGYGAYTYYTKNRGQVDGAIRKFAGGGARGNSREDDEPDLAGGPLSDDARLVHAGEGSVS